MPRPLQLSEVASPAGAKLTSICRLVRSVTNVELATRNSRGAIVVAVKPSRKVISTTFSPSVTRLTLPDSTRWTNSEKGIGPGAAGRRAR